MAEDPFDLFRQTVEQFDPSTSFDPAAFGAMGWPMTPWPGGGGDFSPEAGTKHAVKQLYSAIESLEDGDAPDWLDAVDVGQFGAEGPDQFTTVLAGTYQLWFYSLAQLLVESYTIRLLHDELVVESYRGRVETQRWLWSLGQADREQLLRRCTDLDEDLVTEMEAARERRNDLLYRIGEWDQAGRDAVADAQRYLVVLTELDERVSDDAFDFVPE